MVTMNDCMMSHKAAGDCQIALPTEGTGLAPSPRTRLPLRLSRLIRC